jgi:hypothetical protein
MPAFYFPIQRIAAEVKVDCKERKKVEKTNAREAMHLSNEFAIGVLRFKHVSLR